MIPPLTDVGEYGGNLSVGISSAWSWFGDPQSTVGPETLMRIATDYTGVVPNIVRSWEWEPAGKTVVMHFVQDARWSDGAPFSADSVMWWYNNITLNETLTPPPHSRWTPGGERMKLTQVDDNTIRYEFAAPYPLIEMQYADYSGFTTTMLIDSRVWVPWRDMDEAVWYTHSGGRGGNGAGIADRRGHVDFPGGPAAAGYHRGGALNGLAVVRPLSALSAAGDARLNAARGKIACGSRLCRGPADSFLCIGPIPSSSTTRCGRIWFRSGAGPDSACARSWIC